MELVAGDFNQRVHSSILCAPTKIYTKTIAYERARILGSNF